MTIILFTIVSAQGLHSENEAEFIRFLRTNIAAGLLLVTLLLWFIAQYTGKKALPVLMAVTALMAVLFTVNLIQPYTLQYAHLDGLYKLRLPWGEVITRGKGDHGPWTYVTIAAVVGIFGYAVYAMTDLYRRSRSRAVAWILFGTALFVISSIEGLLVRLSIIHFVALGSYGFLIMVAVMGAALTHEIQHQLRTSEENFRSILRNASDGIHIIDADGNIIEASNTFCDMLGYSRAEVLGMNVSRWDAQFADRDLTDEIARQLARPMRSQHETRHRRRDGSLFDVEVSGFPLELNGKPVLFNSSRDITERKASENRIQNLAFYDQLTDLPNRRLLDDRLKQAMSSSARSLRHGALLLIDLDNFKTINDSVGHLSGDLMLKQIAGRLCTLVRKSDTVARLGGDEFIVLLTELSEEDDKALVQTKTVGEKILLALCQPYQLGTSEFHSSCSIGITTFKGNQSSAEELTKQADIAMYQAKNGGRNNMRFFDPEMQASINIRASLEGDLHKALEQRQFALHYQLQVDDLFRPIGVEGLIRWLHPERGLIPPTEFIPLAEETGLILPIGQWVVETACEQLKQWSQDPQTRDLTVAINVSSKQFRRADFIAQVHSAIQQYRIDSRLLKLELTESMLVDNIEDTIAIMNALKQIGVNFSLDDFGAGYSSLQYLKRLPLDQLKIDQSFVRDIAVDGNDDAIVRTIVAIAKSLNLGVIAEGVETEIQRNLLLDMGCSHFQGYFFARPGPAEEVKAYVKKITAQRPERAAHLS